MEDITHAVRIALVEQQIIGIREQQAAHAKETRERFDSMGGKLDELLVQSADTNRLIELLKDIEGFLSITGKLGKVLKWCFGITAGALATYAAWKGIHR